MRQNVVASLLVKGVVVLLVPFGLVTVGLSGSETSSGPVSTGFGGSVTYRVGNGKNGYRTDVGIPAASLPFLATHNTFCAWTGVAEIDSASAPSEVHDTTSFLMIRS